MMLVIIFEQNFLFYLIVMLETDPALKDHLENCYLATSNLIGG